MRPPILNHARNRTAPSLHLLGELPFALARTHELCGPARRLLALLIARETQGPVFWIQPAWATEHLFPPGVLSLISPDRLIFVTAKRPEDMLWTLEEVLRAGVVPLVVGDLPDPPALTPVRRLHLAARAGAALGHGAPLGILLTPGSGGAAGIESRWHMAPRHGAGHSAWTLERRRARRGAPKTWMLTRRTERFSLSSAQDAAGARPQAKRRL